MLVKLKGIFNYELLFEKIPFLLLQTTGNQRPYGYVRVPGHTAERAVHHPSSC